MKRFRVPFALAVAAISLIVLASPTFAAPRADNAYVRVVHAAPAAPNVDVYVDDNKLLPNFAFGTATDYVPLAAGAHTIKIAPAGQPESAAVISGSATVVAGSYYTIVAIGNSAPAVTPALVIFTDDNSVTPGKAKVRVYHLSDDAGPVSVAAAPGAQPVIPSASFKDASDYLTVAPGAYTFEVTLLNSGTKVNAPVTLELHKVTSVFALGEVGGKGATAFTFVAKTVAGIPTSLPPTGNAPRPASAEQAPVWSLALVAGVLALGLVGAGSFFVVRKRAAQR